MTSDLIRVVLVDDHAVVRAGLRAVRGTAKDIDVVLLQSTEGMKGPMYEGKPAFPSTWARQEGQGRVFYTSMGHDQKGMNTPVFEKVFMAGLKWAAGVTQYTPKPNIAEVAPGLPMAPDN